MCNVTETNRLSCVVSTMISERTIVTEGRLLGCSACRRSQVERIVRQRLRRQLCDREPRRLERRSLPEQRQRWSHAAACQLRFPRGTPVDRGSTCPPMNCTEKWCSSTTTDRITRDTDQASVHCVLYVRACADVMNYMHAWMWWIVCMCGCDELYAPVDVMNYMHGWMWWIICMGGCDDLYACVDVMNCMHVWMWWIIWAPLNVREICLCMLDECKKDAMSAWIKIIIINEIFVMRLSKQTPQNHPIQNWMGRFELMWFECMISKFYPCRWQHKVYEVFRQLK